MKPQSGLDVAFTTPSSQDQDVSVGYSSRDDGKLERTYYRTAGRTGNVEPAEVLHYSPEGQLEEHVWFRYTRDAFGNWIEREMTVFDATTGAEVLVRRDTRGEMPELQKGTRGSVEAFAVLLPNPWTGLLDRSAFTAEEEHC